LKLAETTMKSEHTFLPVAVPLLDGNEAKYVLDCIESGWVSSLGKYIPSFEQRFAEFCEARYGIAVSNGTVALHLALATLGIGPGDEVIVPTLTFVATANAVRYVGATPVFADSDPRTWTMDPEDVARKVTSKTKAIIPVHLYGHPVDMQPIMDLAQERNIFVLEDAAEAHGALYRNKKVGGIGHNNCFSFYGNKIITTGEGGMLTTNDANLAERARFLRDHAMSPERRYWHTEVGYNFRMTNIQAALGLAQMERIDVFIEHKRWLAQRYNELLTSVTGITFPPEASWARSVYWMYSILLDKEFPLDRDTFMSRLKEQGIDSRPFFYPVHSLPPYQSSGGQFPVAEDISRRGINLPSGMNMQEEDVVRVAEEIRKCSLG
jgi:perosamine synthetase